MSGDRRHSILVVDDDRDEADLARIAFSRHPFDIRVASGGAEAIELLKSPPYPDLVLLDLKMPRVGGLEVLAWVRRSPHLRDLPVVMFTSSDHPGDIEAAKSAGADDYVCKTADLGAFDTVASRIQEIMAARRGPHGP